MDKKTKVLRDFKSSLVMFLDELIGTFPSEQDFITLRILVNDQIPTQTIMDFFVDDLDGVKHRVSTRDETFFTSGNPIFSKLDKEAQFKRIWLSSDMDVDNKTTMWRWFSQFVKFADTYAKL